MSTSLVARRTDSRYLPNRSVAGLAPDDEVPVGIALLHARGQVNGKPTAYLCESYACQTPVTDAESLAEQLDGLR